MISNGAEVLILSNNKAFPLDFFWVVHLLSSNHFNALPKDV